MNTTLAFIVFIPIVVFILLMLVLIASVTIIEYSRRKFDDEQERKYWFKDKDRWRNDRF